MPVQEEISTLKMSGECKCGFKREFESDDLNTMQQIKEMSCHHCGGRLKYKSYHPATCYAALTCRKKSV